MRREFYRKSRFILLFVFLFLTFSISPVILAQGVDLSVTKTSNPNPATIGNPLTYTITVSIPSPGAAGAVITDTLPSGLSSFIVLPSLPFYCSPITGTVPITYTQMILCSLGNISSTITGTFPIRIVAIPGVTGVITNTVTVGSSTPPDPNPSNNSASAAIMVRFPFEVSKVPTLRDWGMVIMILIFGGASIYLLRKKRMV
jgi:uncharacterized repeat protein (TIGR01451 family)